MLAAGKKITSACFKSPVFSSICRLLQLLFFCIIFSITCYFLVPNFIFHFKNSGFPEDFPRENFYYSQDFAGAW